MNPSAPRAAPADVVALLTVGAAWGLHGPLLKLAYQEGLHFAWMSVGEYALATLAFGLAWRSSGSGWPREGRGFWLQMLLGGVVGSGVALFLFWSYQRGPVPVGATLLFLYVPFTSLLTALVHRRRPPARELASVGLVTAGAVLATGFLGVVGPGSLRGAPQAILAALCFAGFFHLSAGVGNRSSPVFRSFFYSAVSGLFLLAVSLAAGWTLNLSVPRAGRTLGWLAVLAAVGQVVPVFLLMRSAHRVGGGLGSILTSLELPVAVGLSSLLLGDPLRTSQLGGIALILAGIALPHGRRGPRPGSPGAA
ncbi:MAG: DMT family transporter [Verrucomicrobiota bacterium]